VSPRLPRVTADELLAAFKRDGWFISRQSGSHAILHHPGLSGCVVIPRHAGITIKPSVIQDPLDQSGLSADELRELL